MTRLPGYVCVICGRAFTTARSGRRHVANVEGGNSFIVTEADHRVGLLMGRIPPPVPKALRKPQPKEDRARSWLFIAEEEYMKGFFWQMGAKAFHNITKPEDIDNWRRWILMRAESNVQYQEAIKKLAEDKKSYDFDFSKMFKIDFSKYFQSDKENSRL